MVELLWRAVDKTADDVRRDTKLTKRGDVIVRAGDGHGWGSEEKSNPDWRILSVPHLSASEASMLLSPEPLDDPTNPSMTLQRRMYSFDLDDASLSNDLKEFIADETRTSHLFVLDLPVEGIRALIKRKPAIDDPTAL